MKVKTYFIPISICLVYLNIVSGHRIAREVGHEDILDSLDTETIAVTGCKYIYLRNGESKQFSPDSLVNILRSQNLAYGGNLKKFEIHFAVRSAPEVDVYWFSKRSYEETPTNPDFIFNYGSDFVKSTISTAMVHDGERQKLVKQQNTGAILSNEKYTKLYIKLDKGKLYYGEDCKSTPFYADTHYGNYYSDIVQLGFSSKSEYGSKILYDCPAPPANCNADPK